MNHFSTNCSNKSNSKIKYVTVLLAINILFYCGFLLLNNQENKEFLMDELPLMRSRNTKKENSKNAYCLLGLGALPTGEFCLSLDNPVVGGNHYFSSQLCKNIEDVVQYSAVGDFGAGLGIYGSCLLRKKYPVIMKTKAFLGANLAKNFQEGMKRVRMYQGEHQVIKSWEGFDGAINVEEVTKGFVKHFELTQSFDLGKRYDWIISLEVGEHIPKKFERIFIENLTKHACKGLIITWAVPGQTGLNHINNLTNEEVISKLRENNFVFNQTETLILRNNLTSYFLYTSMVFRRVNQHSQHC